MLGCLGEGDNEREKTRNSKPIVTGVDRSHVFRESWAIEVSALMHLHDTQHSMAAMSTPHMHYMGIFNV